MLRNYSLALTLFVLSFSSLFAQEDIIQAYLQREKENLQLVDQDLDFEIYDQHTQTINNKEITYVYIRQVHDGRSIYQATANFVVSDGNAVMTGNRLVSNVADRMSNVKQKDFAVTPEGAVQILADEIGVTTPYKLKKLREKGNYDVKFEASELSHEPIPVKLMYQLVGEELQPVWDLSIYQRDEKHWWSARIHAETGSIIDKVDWVQHCTFDGCTQSSHKHKEAAVMLPAPPPGTDQYNVFAIPVESPNHGPRTLLVGPYEPSASPFGWHDDNGVAGEEYTITRGNNVYAYEDQNDSNTPGYSPDGGPTLNFDFPLNLNQPANQYLDPAITNLFYMNNIMHDIWYQYGFDEASGNFQENNYGNGGQGGDYVEAQAQDGGGTNNANFATPPEGDNPRMQMYLWDASGGSPNILTVNSPGGLAGTYTAVEAAFGPGVPSTPITSDLVIYEDATPDTYDACENAINGPSMNGRIVLIRRGTCTFVSKIERAQAEGAAAVIMINNQAAAPFAMGGNGGSITIPSVMISQADGAALIAEIENGGTVNATLVNAGPFEYDGDFDNGIVAHEYGHGISIRLTGGASNVNCLNNDEQMGEGWSDWFGLMLTIEPGDQATDVRGIGTFAVGEPTDGGGIRPAPYSTDPGVNNFTYAATNNTGSISQPHGIGFVWCTMLWDMTWALIDDYGYDSDLYNGTGGNNIAMHLVMQALKLQACSPGFVDGRDAILQADQLLYGGAHECLIWTVFANRGLGYSADQGSSDSRTDQVEAFDMPPGIGSTTTITSCGDYTWSVDGQTYSSTGTYTAPLPSPVCGDTIATLNLTVISNVNTNVTQAGNILQANLNSATYQWLDCDNNFAIIPGATTQTFTAPNDGNYAVIVTTNLGCSDTSACFVVATSGLFENNLETELTVYPNPTQEDVHIDLGQVFDAMNYVLYDVSGRAIQQGSAEQVQSFELDINGSEGQYLLELTDSEGWKARVKLLKTK